MSESEKQTVCWRDREKHMGVLCAPLKKNDLVDTRVQSWPLPAQFTTVISSWNATKESETTVWNEDADKESPMHVYIECLVICTVLELSSPRCAPDSRVAWGSERRVTSSLVCVCLIMILSSTTLLAYITISPSHSSRNVRRSIHHDVPVGVYVMSVSFIMEDQLLRACPGPGRDGARARAWRRCSGSPRR